jgi:BirA family biotin operon repressor/biotin-[acetyl-CoA-carboxylase] ligase
VVVGIGLNINTVHFPRELSEIAGSLYLATGSRQNRAQVLAAILGSLELWIDRLQSGEPQAVIERWQEFAGWLGREITVRRSDGDVVGIALGVDTAGRLLLRDRHGQEIVVVAGDVLDMPDHRSGCEPC